jgi:hypothetical protein
MMGISLIVSRRFSGDHEVEPVSIPTFLRVEIGKRDG